MRYFSILEPLEYLCVPSANNRHGGGLVFRANPAGIVCVRASQPTASLPGRRPRRESALNGGRSSFQPNIANSRQFFKKTITLIRMIRCVGGRETDERWA